jgi:putative FmdB family regulatory protein
VPIFEYRCQACGGDFEDLVARAGDAAPPCPRCGATRVTRRLSAFAVTSARPERAVGPCGSSDCACRSGDGAASG